MDHIRIRIALAAERAEEAADALLDLGIAFEQHDATTLERPAGGRAMLTVYAAPGEELLVEGRLRDLLAPLDANLEVSTTVVDSDAWQDTWKVHFKPRPVGPFVLVPSWEVYASSPGETAIALDPGRAFGTGGHASTRLCLRALGRVPRCARFLDVGCGSGVLAIACALRWPAAEGAAVDNDPEAVAVTEENAEKNQVSARIAMSGTPLEELTGSFDVVLANLTAPTLVALAAPLARRVGPGGRLIASGILAEEATTVAAALIEAGLRALESEDEEEWRALVMTRP